MPSQHEYGYVCLVTAGSRAAGSQLCTHCPARHAATNVFTGVDICCFITALSPLRQCFVTAAGRPCRNFPASHATAGGAGEPCAPCLQAQHAAQLSQYLKHPGRLAGECRADAAAAQTATVHNTHNGACCQGSCSCAVSAPCPAVCTLLIVPAGYQQCSQQHGSTAALLRPMLAGPAAVDAGPLCA